ncbi:Hsp20/alpha crystallin family protein [Terriglobus sp. ADX1]|uniref:Hsp20/alpha crystallin family protein n=1 Tax=Terriglobus sp. ADX1 TaxID=2794063 RepID=UPI002FE59678
MADDLMLEMKRIDDEIRQLAFHLFRDHGAFPGMELEDWIKAEKMLLRPVVVDLEQTDKEIIARADVPGFNESDLKVRVDRHCIRICGKTQQVQESRKERTVPCETSQRMIRAVVELPDSVDEENSSYRVTDGVLIVMMPKLEKENERASSRKAA